MDDFATYFKNVKPLLDAENGREIRSYLLFHGEGGQAKYAGYKTRHQLCPGGGLPGVDRQEQWQER